MSNLKEKCALHFLDFFDAIFTHVHPLLKWMEITHGGLIWDQTPPF